jgi:beta-glucoside operon transcriptional antiterminator
VEVLRVFNNNVLARAANKGVVILTGRGLWFQRNLGSR